MIIIMFKRIIQQIVDKLFCLHEYEEKHYRSVMSHESDTLPLYSKVTYMCKKCGNIKQIKL
jgi:hypothetical protein